LNKLWFINSIPIQAITSLRGSQIYYYSLCSELRENYQYLQYTIDIVRIIIIYTLILYIFDIIEFDIFTNILGLTLSNLTLTKAKMQNNYI
jgi:hypothetical protein